MEKFQQNNKLENNDEAKFAGGIILGQDTGPGIIQENIPDARFKFNDKTRKHESISFNKEEIEEVLEVGDSVQLVNNGKEVFSEPLKVISISRDGNTVFVEGIKVGIPIKEFRIIEKGIGNKKIIKRVNRIKE